MRMVIVNPKIWNVIVIGILSPPLRGETKPPIAVLEPQGFNRTAYILTGKSKNVNPCGRFRALDKPQEPAIIKIAKDTSTSGCPRFRSWKRENSKPSLGRVAVSPVNADRNSQSKDMESQSDRHRNTPFTEDSGENRPSLFWRPWGSKRTNMILPDQLENVNLRRLCPLDKSKVSGIIKITKAPSARTVWPRIKLVFQEISKPSLCRVAVSAIYADGDRQSKNMERDRNRHKHPSFRRRPNRPSASGALGFK